MPYPGSCKLYLMKCFFMFLLFFTVLALTLRLLHHVHPMYEVLPEPKLTEAPWERLLMNLSQDDVELVGKLRAGLVLPPPGAYHLRGPEPLKEHVLQRAVRRLFMLHHPVPLQRGYFVEVGAGDGEDRSPTIGLETEDKWLGLLIEADPRLWGRLKAKRRKATLALGCVGFANTSYMGRLSVSEPGRSRVTDGPGPAQVPCYPLYSFLLAARAAVVDFLVVNINGGELDVLRTLPWPMVKINIIAVCYGTKDERIGVAVFLDSVGYLLSGKYHQEGESFLMFVRRKFKD